MVLNIPQCVSLLWDLLVVRQCVLGDSLQPGLTLAWSASCLFGRDHVPSNS